MSPNPMSNAHLYLAGVGAVVAEESLGLGDGLAARLAGAGAGAAEPAVTVADRTRLRREQGLRYVDADAELAIAAAPERAGILVATVHGARNTRERLVKTLLERSGSVSGTLFANVGHNIAGSLMARSLNIRGPVLTFAAGPQTGRDLLRLAHLLFQAGRADLLLVGCADATAALVLALTPAGTTPLPDPAGMAAADGGLDGLCRLAARTP